jgi:hypothetical protein
MAAIDVTFDFRSDTLKGKDPDSFSPDFAVTTRFFGAKLYLGEPHLTSG